MKTTRPASTQAQQDQSIFRKPHQGFFNPKPLVSPAAAKFYRSIQQKSLEVNQPGDAYEQEADAVADKVMRMPVNAPAVSPVSRREEELQRKEGDPEDRMQTGSTDHAPVASAERERDEMQIGETDPAPLRRQPAGMLEDEDKMRTGDTDMTPLQRKEEEDMVQAKGEGTPAVTPSFETSLQRSKGGGSPLPDGVKQQMEGGIGADFSNVRLHTGTQAAEMSSSIQAQAFTHGKDIYFNEGKYSPGTDSGKHLLAHELTHTVQQGAADKIARQGEKGTQTKKAPPVPVNKTGIVAWDGQPPLKLRSGPSTDSPVLGALSLNTHVQIIDYPAGDPTWYHISTADGRTGYAASKYIKPYLPEPTAELYRIHQGDTAIGIAQKFYGKEAGRWGMDLRFYVNVLAYVNHIKIPDNSFGWKQLQLTAGNFIWIPGKNFARGLKGKVNSGSMSYNAADALGVAGYLGSIMQKLTDFRNAVGYSGAYLGTAVKTRFAEAIQNSLKALLDMLLISAGVLAVSTAIGAAIGALLGGVGAAPGAAVGFEVGMLLLEWLGMAFLIKWIAEAVGKIGSMFAKFLRTVWYADGNLDKLKKGGKEFAEAIAELLGTLLEAAVMYVAALGLKAGMNKIKGTKLGEKLNMREWIERKATERNGEKKAVEERKSKQEERPLETANKEGDFMSTEAKPGKPYSAETIRTGEVIMEEHPSYHVELAKLKAKGYELRFNENNQAHVVFREVYNKGGELIRTEKYINIQKGRRFIDLEHEISHVEQLEGPLNGKMPTEKVTDHGNGRITEITNASNVINEKFDAVTEYHARLIEYKKLLDRGAGKELLDEHMKGLQHAREIYTKHVFKNIQKDAKLLNWSKQYFPEISQLEITIFKK